MQDSTGVEGHLTWQDTAFFVEEAQAIVPDSPSLFDGHLLLPQDAELPLIDPPVSMGWVFGVLAFCLVLLVLAHRGNGPRPWTVFRASFDRGLTGQITRYGQWADSAPFWFMLMAAVSSLAFFLTVLVGMKNPAQETGAMDFFRVLAVVVSLGLGTRALHGISGAVFNIPDLIREHGLDRSVMVVSCGLFLFPMSVLHFYGPPWVGDMPVTLGVVAIGVFWLKDLQRVMTLLWAESVVNMAHIFYYLCAFKILPLFVVLRLAAEF